MAKSISTIQTELCDSEIGKLRSPISLYQVIGELYSTAEVLGGSFILLESGDFMLLESGGKILLE